MWSPFFFAGKSGAAGAKKFVLQLFFCPLRGLIIFHSYPRLAPWALILSRFAAVFEVESDLFES